MIPQYIRKLLDFEFKERPQYSYKQYILIRTDRKFSVGKLMVHAAHNSCSAILWEFQTKKGVWEDHPRLMKWFNSGMCQAKIVVSVNSERDLWKWIEKTHQMFPEIPIAIVPDGGAYEVEKETIIGCSIGPVTVEEAKQLGLNKLSLFKYKNV